MDVQDVCAMKPGADGINKYFLMSSLSSNPFPSSLSQMFIASSSLLFRRNSKQQDSTESEPASNHGPFYTKRFKRPIDFRSENSSLLKHTRTKA